VTTTNHRQVSVLRLVRRWLLLESLKVVFVRCEDHYFDQWILHGYVAEVLSGYHHVGLVIELAYRDSVRKVRCYPSAHGLVLE
jgi:hypothetical protein